MLAVALPGLVLPLLGIKMKQLLAAVGSQTDLSCAVAGEW